MTRCYLLVISLAFVLLGVPVYAGNVDNSAAQKTPDALNSGLRVPNFEIDTFFINQSKMQRTYVPPTAMAKKPGHYTIADWRSAIDSTWGPGLPKAQKLQIFDAFWNAVDANFACFNGIFVDWGSLQTLYRNEIENGDPLYGVSRGRFAAIMNHLSLAVKENHTQAADMPINWQTALTPGIPLMAVGWTGLDNGHFGAGLTPLPDSSLLVYKVVPNHPLGLEPGDVVLGYDHIPWKQLYRELLEAELPFANTYWGSCESSIRHSFLMAAGMNWHLFDTLDVVKYNTGDTLHLSVAPLIGQNMSLMCTEQMDIPGVPMPNTEGGQWVSYGIVEGTQIGYIYGRAWMPEQVGDQFQEAVQDLVENHQTSGLIIDFRSNLGGYALLANDGLSYLFNSKELATDFAYRCNSQDHLALCPMGISRSCQVAGRASPIYDKPIAVLTGPGAGSAGDLATIKFKFLSTARIFGKSTAGMFNAAMTLGGHSDWWLRCAFANEYFVSQPGQYLTHRELPVDEHVWLTKDGVAQGRDDVVEAAISWINSVQGNEPTQLFDPASLHVTVESGQIANGVINIQNNGNWPLLYSLTPQISNPVIANSESNYNASTIPISATKTAVNEQKVNSVMAGRSDPPTITAHGGFDGSGHIWMDSDQPHGPAFEWVDISGIGTPLGLGDDDYIGPWDLGFSFPFYGRSYSEIFVGSNGLLTFGNGSADYSNDPIPTPASPNNVIAPFWVDLNPYSGGSIYYYRDRPNQRFIVSFIEVPYYGPTGSLTFQAVLNANGEIDFNYGRMAAGLLGNWWNYQYSSPATIGIENVDGGDGLQVAYDENYMHDSLSIKIYPSWLAVGPASGHVMPGGSETATVSFRAGSLAPGTYTGNVYLETNDPSTPSVAIPVSMEVERPPCSYIPGDANGEGTFNGVDVSYSVNYLKGFGALPPDSCDCPPHGIIRSAADANGNCQFNGVDVTYSVNYLKGLGPAPLPCPDCPPARLSQPAPLVAPHAGPLQQSGVKQKPRGAE